MGRKRLSRSTAASLPRRERNGAYEKSVRGMMDIAGEPARRASKQTLLLLPAAVASILLVLRLVATELPESQTNEAAVAVIALAAAVLALVAAFRSPDRSGRPWLLIAAGSLGWGYWFSLEAGHSTQQDALLNASYLLLVASIATGALLLCRFATDRVSRVKLLLDLLPPAIVLAVAIWILSVGPFVLDDGVSSSMRISAVIHGLGSVIFLVVGVAGALSERRNRFDAATRIMLVATVLLALADVAWLQQLTGALERSNVAIVAFGVTFATIGLSAFVAIRRAGKAGRHAVDHREVGGSGWESLTPDVALGALLLLAGGQVIFGEPVAYGLLTTIACALAMLATILARQWIVHHRERHLRLEIDKLSEQIDGLISQVGRDPLTGLLNHRAIHERIDHELASGRARKHPVAVVLIDVDNFKTVNDTLGHQSGDRVLRAVSSILTAACRGTDVAARYAGDEFMLLLPGLDEAYAGLVCERIAQEVRRVNQELDLGPSVIVSLSVGVAVTHGCQRSVAQTVAIADAAMYDAKEGGKNRIVVVNADTLVISEEHEPARSPDQLMAESRELFWSEQDRRAG
jgi:diguanylate cyclase (GGDEF)-like protein